MPFVDTPGLELGPSNSTLSCTAKKRTTTCRFHARHELVNRSDAPWSGRVAIFWDSGATLRVEFSGGASTTAAPVELHERAIGRMLGQPSDVPLESASAELAIASARIDEMVAANQRLPQLDFSGTFTPQGRSIDRTANQQTGDPGIEGNWRNAFRNIFSDDIQQDGLLADWVIQGSLTLTWDVQNRAPKGRHQAAKLQIKKAEVNLERARQQVAAGVIRAANSLRTAGKVMDVAQISVELAQENLAAEQARFEVGRSTNYDVLLRLDELDKAWASALSAQVGYLKALVQLQALNGEILPAYGFDTPD